MLAAIYDHVMSHVDYYEWAHYVDRVFRGLGHSHLNVIETACGTGKIGRELAMLGHNVVGCDLSYHMVRTAQHQNRYSETNIPLFAADMCALPVRQCFDAVVCLYDSINYLLSLESVKQAVESAFDTLHKEGIFIFDVCTIYNSKHHFNRKTTREKGDGFRYTRKCRFDKKNMLQYNTFYIHFTDHHESFIEEHVQKIYPLSDILSVINASEFKLMGYYDDTTFKQASEHSERVHFVLIK